MTGEAGSITSKLLMCGGGVRTILLLPLVARCLETIDVCIWRMFVVWWPLLKIYLFMCSCQTWICLDITHFYEEQRLPYSESA